MQQALIALICGETTSHIAYGLAVALFILICAKAYEVYSRGRAPVATLKLYEGREQKSRELIWNLYRIVRANSNNGSVIDSKNRWAMFNMLDQFVSNNFQEVK